MAKELCVAPRRGSRRGPRPTSRGLAGGPALARACSRRRRRRAGTRVDVEDDQNGVAPYLALPGSYDEYLAGLPSKLRHEIKRKARKLESEVGPWHICLATPEDLECLARHVRRAASHERGSQGRLHAAGDGDLLPSARGGVPAPRDLPPHVHRARGSSQARRHDRVPLRGDVLPLQLGVRSRVSSRSRPGWCSWPRTSASRSRGRARPSTCSRATTRTSTASVRCRAPIKRLIDHALTDRQPRLDDGARDDAGVVPHVHPVEPREFDDVTSHVDASPPSPKSIGRRSIVSPEGDRMVTFAVPDHPGARDRTSTQDWPTLES